MLSKKIMVGLMIYGFSLNFYPLSAAIPSDNTSSNIASNLSEISPLPPLPPLPQKTEKVNELPRPSKPVERKVVNTEATYFHPGILILKNGKWEGGDYLYNLNDSLGVYVNIIEPEGESSELNQESLLKGVVDQFTKNAIKVTTSAKEGAPPLPFFQIQILVYPFGTGYAACCKGSLFEEVSLKRINLDTDAFFQAITWQRESLIVTPNTAFISQIDKSISETVNAFIERYRIYRELKNNP